MCSVNTGGVVRVTLSGDVSASAGGGVGHHARISSVAARFRVNVDEQVGVERVFFFFLVVFLLLLTSIVKRIGIARFSGGEEGKEGGSRIASCHCGRGRRGRGASGLSHVFLAPLSSPRVRSMARTETRARGGKEGGERDAMHSDLNELGAVVVFAQ